MGVDVGAARQGGSTPRQYDTARAEPPRTADEEEATRLDPAGLDGVRWAPRRRGVAVALALRVRLSWRLGLGEAGGVGSGRECRVGVGLGARKPSRVRDWGIGPPR